MDDRLRLLTFLHGIEPRAWVLLNVQCNDPGRASALFRETLVLFASEAATEPLARWPMRFWTILLSRPGLTVDAGLAGEAASGLARIPPGPRVVFLLPMVAGLDEAHATEALGVTPRLLAQALVRARTAWADPEAHDALRELLQARIREPTAGDRKAMQALRDEALAQPSAPSTPATSKPRRWAWLIMLVLLALAWLVIAVLTGRQPLAPGHSEVLPMEVTPALAPLDAAGIVTHPDYVQLAAPGDARLAQDLALLSWFAAGASAVANTGAATVGVTSLATSDLADFDRLPEAERELLESARSTWANLDSTTREHLSAQAKDWLGKTSAERDSLRQGIVAWDRLAPAERARQRAPFEAWQQLSNEDRTQLRLAAQRWATLPAAEQVAARGQFAALSDDARHLWLLGPSLGRELAPIAARYAFLPEDDRNSFLTMLRGLDQNSRSDFITLSAHLEPGESDRLRRDLQAQAPSLRGAWLRARLPQ
jgi:hypothetical protein